MKRTKYILDGLNVTIIKTDKFKTTDISLNFKQYLNPNNITKRALIPYVLKAATNKYPNKKEINRKLETLYGANLGVSVSKQGKLHLLSFKMSIVNDKYLMKNNQLLDDSFAFLHEILFNPKLENNTFSQKVVNEEKRLLKEQFISLYDDKIRYSYHRLIEEMCKEENYAIKAIGRLEDLENLTTENLYAEYQNIIDNDTIDLLVIGDVDEDRVEALVNKYLPFKKRDKITDVVDEERKTIHKVNEVVEVKDVSQAKLNIGYRTNTTGNDDDYYALMLMNAILGLYPNSLLFRNVREEASLCYYIASNISKGKGIMIIYAGINYKDYQKAYKIISEQITKLIKGDFTESLVENCRKALINDLLQTTDSPLAFLTSEYSYSLYQQVFDIDYISDKLQDVTKEEIVRVAQKLEEDTIFLLTSEEVSL